MGHLHLLSSRTAAGVGLPLLCGALMLGWVGPVQARAPRAPSDTPRRATSFNGEVRAVVYSGDRVYLGGAFTRATSRGRTVVRRHVAALNARTGALLRWNPRTNGTVRAIAVFRDDVYLGGDFSTVRGVRRERLAKVSNRGRLERGLRRGANRRVSALAVGGHSLYVGGDFGAVAGRDRNRLAAFNLLTGGLRSWSPSTTGLVRALATGGSRVYVGGDFSRINGVRDTKHLGAVSTRRRGRVLGSFHPSIRYDVHAIVATPSRVFAGADGPGGHLRAFGLRGGDRWDLPTDGGVQGLTVLNHRIYFGGHFDRACRAANPNPGSCPPGRVERRKLAAVNAHGRLLAWNPQANSKLGVLAMDSATRPARVAAGGAFTRMHGRSLERRFFAQFG